jgi:hypothetical protein
LHNESAQIAVTPTLDVLEHNRASMLCSTPTCRVSFPSEERLFATTRSVPSATGRQSYDPPEPTYTVITEAPGEGEESFSNATVNEIEEEHGPEIADVLRRAGDKFYNLSLTLDDYWMQITPTPKETPKT